MQKNNENNLVIIGASGHGKVAADIALKMKKWKNICFLDDDKQLEEPIGLKVIGQVSDYKKYVENAEIFIAIGSNETRKKIMEELKRENVNLTTLIHPNVVIGSKVELGKGTIVMAGTIINSDTRIGEGCIINTGATIDHDNIVEDYVHVSPGVNTAGNVTINNESWIGIGAVISNNLEIGEKIIVGAGAVVTNNLNEKGVYIGVPARRYRNENFNISE